MLGFAYIGKLHTTVRKAPEVIVTFIEEVDYWNFQADGIIVGPIYFCVLLGLVHRIL